MKEIYILGKDDRFPTLVQDDSNAELNTENDFALYASSLKRHGVPFGSDYTPLQLKIADEDRHKKGVSDIQTHFMSFLIFSRHAFDVLSDLIGDFGQTLPVDDRFPDLIDFHVTHLAENAVNFEKSEYVMHEKGPVIRRVALIKKNVIDLPIFKLKEDPTRVFVSNDFRIVTEKIKLRGFSFIRRIELT